MSDDAKDDGTPEVKLDAAGGFMPDPPPPALLKILRKRVGVFQGQDRR